MIDVSVGKRTLDLRARGVFRCASVYARPFAPVSAASLQRLARTDCLEKIAKTNGRNILCALAGFMQHGVRELLVWVLWELN